MKELVEYLAQSVVDQPELVTVNERRSGERVFLTLKVAEGDRGKVIGRNGRIAQAMRSLVKVAAIREGVRAQLEIAD